MIIADTHSTESLGECDRCHRRSSCGCCTEGEPSEKGEGTCVPGNLRSRSSQTLTSLDLASNEIDAEGAEHMANALRVNQVRGKVACLAFTPR